MLLGGLIGINDTWLRDGGLFKGDLNTIKKKCYSTNPRRINQYAYK